MHSRAGALLAVPSGFEQMLVAVGQPWPAAALADAKQHARLKAHGGTLARYLGKLLA